MTLQIADRTNAHKAMKRIAAVYAQDIARFCNCRTPSEHIVIMAEVDNHKTPARLFAAAVASMTNDMLLANFPESTQLIKSLIQSKQKDHDTVLFVFADASGASLYVASLSDARSATSN
jgi:hypothetical protein